MSWLTHLAERMIDRAVQNGELQGLAGEGKPLPDRPVEAFVDPLDAAALRMMAEAGALPEEIRLKKLAAALRAQIGGLPDGPARSELMAQLRETELRQAIAEESRRQFMKR